LLEDIGITANKNSIPFDKQNSFVTSGIRQGTPALTTRGMTATEMEMIATLIAEIIMHPGDKQVAQNAKENVQALCEAFPLYQNIDKGDIG
ncbi:MAG: serine hydroxymethyltransferase, partial [Deltaproteobacteria bacterium]|nr:serine hydroxymethyltransferase [Deltaproteobacteria bacterium]